MLKVTPSKETLTAWQNRPQKVVASYIKKVLELSASKANGQIRTATVIYFIREHKLNLYEKVALYRLIRWMQTSTTIGYVSVCIVLTIEVYDHTLPIKRSCCLYVEKFMNPSQSKWRSTIQSYFLQQSK